MSIGVNISTYSEEFRSPGPTKPTQARPSSPNRRNKPHPRPDFLLPRMPTRCLAKNIVPVPVPVSLGYCTHFFPPVQHKSIQYQVGKNTPIVNFRVGKVEPSHRQVGNSARECFLPPSGRLFKHQSHVQSPSLNKEQMCTNLQNKPRGISGNDFRRGTVYKFMNDGKISREELKSQGYFKKSCPKAVLDSNGGYSCFQVVKPYQAGHYVIHPEFVSENLN